MIIQRFSHLAICITLGIVLLGTGMVTPKSISAFNLNDILVDFDKKELKNLPKQVTKFAPVTFEVPIDLMDIPNSFNGADLVVRCLAVSTSPPRGLVGGWKTKKGLLNGSAFQGKVSVPGNEVYGMISDLTRGECIAFAKKDKMCLIFGTGCLSGSCGDPLSGQVKCEPLMDQLILRTIN